MSEREFDAYLKLLGGLLRLSPGQREQIAGELRDHMEERLDALLAAGISREEAVAQALEEFGDVAALAASFRQIAWNRKRRWIMRCTAASIVCVFVGILAISAFWPGDQQANGVLANARAQGNASQSEAAGKQETEDRNARTRLRLAQRGTVDFDQAPLDDAIEYIVTLFDLQAHFDQTELENSGIDPSETGVDLNLNDIRGDMMLDLVLSQVDCAYLLRDGIVIITTREEAEFQLVLRVYECGDLIANDPIYSQEIADEAFGEEELDLECGMTQLGSTSHYRPEELSLVELIKRSTGKDGSQGWEESGTGPGTIYRYNDKLVVNQTEKVHSEIEGLLESLRTGVSR